jgi:hypothetical protein
MHLRASGYGGAYASRGGWRDWTILLAFGFVGWAYCGLLIGIGRQFLPMDEVLLVHAVGAPLGFALISYIYFRRFAFMSALRTAAIFVGVAFALDLFLVAPVFEQSFIMFQSPLGTWIPIAGIFAATYLSALLAKRRLTCRQTQL